MLVTVTEHRALVWLYSVEDAEGMIARSFMKPGQFHFAERLNLGKSKSCGLSVMSSGLIENHKDVRGDFNKKR